MKSVRSKNHHKRLITYNLTKYFLNFNGTVMISAPKIIENQGKFILETKIRS